MDNAEWMWKYLEDTNGRITLDAGGSGLKLIATVFGGACVFEGANPEEAIGKLRAAVTRAKNEDITLETAGWGTAENSVWTKVVQCPFTAYEKVLRIRRQVEIRGGIPVVKWQYLRYKNAELEVVNQAYSLYELFEVIEADLSDSESEAHKELFYMAH